MDHNSEEKILRLPQVIAKTGLSRSTIYLMAANGDFPKPISLGLRASGWSQSEVDEWINEKIQNRDRKGFKDQKN